MGALKQMQIEEMDRNAERIEKEQESFCMDEGVGFREPREKNKPNDLKRSNNDLQTR